MKPDMQRVRARLTTWLRIPLVKQGFLVVLALVGLLAFLRARPSDVGATPSEEPPAPPPLPTPATSTASTAAPKPPVPTTAQIVFNTVPPTRALVTWGKKKLGRIEPNRPLVVVRPRDSGPLDVTVRAEGFLPVHTRAHTFSDTKVLVKLTAPDQTATLLGYRVPLDAGAPLDLEGQLDGGTSGFPEGYPTY